MCTQPGQGTKDEHARRDLKLELLQAERDAAARKAKGERGYVQDQKLLALASSTTTGDAPTTENGESESAAKRRKMLQEVADLDKDDSDDDDEADEHDGAIGAKQDKGKGRATSNDDDDDDDSDEDSDDDDDEDETAELLRELEKIKKERAEEKERQVRLFLSFTLNPFLHTRERVCADANHRPIAGTGTRRERASFAGRGDCHRQVSCKLLKRSHSRLGPRRNL